MVTLVRERCVTGLLYVEAFTRVQKRRSSRRITGSYTALNKCPLQSRHGKPISALKAMAAMKLRKQ